MAYRVITVDLSQATPDIGKELVPSSQRIAEVDILYMPTGATIELALGSSADFFTVQDRFYAAPKGDDVQGGSLRYRNLTPQAATSIQVLVSFETGNLNVAP